jgi:hypothetical protein
MGGLPNGGVPNGGSPNVAAVHGSAGHAPAAAVRGSRIAGSGIASSGIAGSGVGTLQVPIQRSLDALPGGVAVSDPHLDTRFVDAPSRQPAALLVPPEIKPDDIQPHEIQPEEIQPHENDLQSRRVRVVLAERKGVARPVRTVVDIQEGTGVGELLRSNLIGSQLAVALRFAVGAGLTLGLLPLLFAFFPEIGLIDVFGLRLPWLLLGFLVYPFLLGLGWWHTRTAERVEQNFADHVQD